MEVNVAEGGVELSHEEREVVRLVGAGPEQTSRERRVSKRREER